MITRVTVGLGSNLSDPVWQVLQAFFCLSEIAGCSLIQRSCLYANPAVGTVEQPDFVNAVALLETSLGPVDLLEELLRIERERGRRKTQMHWGPRIIDLDLLTYGNETIASDILKVPHPEIQNRAFVLLPLSEMAPELEIPGLGTAGDLVSNLDCSNLAVIDESQL